MLLLLVLAGAGTVYQAVATARDERNFPPPGQMIVVGGHRLHIQCAGSTQPGGATVILESGTGLASPAWAIVQSLVSSATRVCAYDRAGNGWSEPGPLPRDAQHIADELHVLLDRAEVAPPYVLVGHSFGGMYVRAYAAAHPEEVVGLVLVDSSNPDQLARSPSRSAKLEGFKRILWAAPLLVHLGIVRLSGLGNVEGFDIPPLEQAEMNAFGAAPSQSVAVLAELEGFAATANVLRAATNLNSRPLYVLTAGEGADADWPELQNELVKLSSNSVHQVLSGSTHETILFTQKGAKAVGAAILAVLEAARTGQPLAQ